MSCRPVARLSREEFVDSVVAVLASSADTLPGLAAAMRGGCLFDSSSFARHLESLYLSMAVSLYIDPRILHRMG